MALGDRLSTENLMNSGQRTRLLEAVRTTPGIHLREAQRRAEMGRGELMHHVRILQRAHLVDLRPIQGRVHLFSPNAEPSGDLPLLRHTARRVLHHISAHESSSSSEIAESLALSERLVRYHLSRLEEKGLIAINQEHPPRYAHR